MFYKVNIIFMKENILLLLGFIGLMCCTSLVEGFQFKGKGLAEEVGS